MFIPKESILQKMRKQMKELRDHDRYAIEDGLDAAYYCVYHMPMTTTRAEVAKHLRAMKDCAPSDLYATGVQLGINCLAM